MNAVAVGRLCRRGDAPLDTCAGDSFIVRKPPACVTFNYQTLISLSTS